MDRRLIKFNVWDASTNVMHRHSDVHNNSLIADAVFRHDKEWEKQVFDEKQMRLLQFTGKLCHNNRELFEGDIVFYEEAGDDGDERHWLVIVWIPEWCMFASVFIDEYKKFLKEGAEALDEVMFWTYTLRDSENYHYAGNIYEHKDLLEKYS